MSILPLTDQLKDDIEMALRQEIDELKSTQRPIYLSELNNLSGQMIMMIKAERERIDQLLSVESESRIAYFRNKAKELLCRIISQREAGETHKRYVTLMCSQLGKHRIYRPAEFNKMKFLEIERLQREGLYLKTETGLGSKVKVRGQNGLPDIYGRASSVTVKCEVIVMSEDGTRRLAYANPFHLEILPD